MTIDGVDIGDILCGTRQAWRIGYPAFETILPKNKGSRALETIGTRANECTHDLDSGNKGGFGAARNRPIRRTGGN